MYPAIRSSSSSSANWSTDVLHVKSVFSQSNRIGELFDDFRQIIKGVAKLGTFRHRALEDKLSYASIIRNLKFVNGYSDILYTLINKET